MKKRFILGFIICTMLFLVACGKHEVTVTMPNDVEEEETEAEITKVERTGELTGTVKLEDCFVITGSGYVYTGDVESGAIGEGDEVIIIEENGNETKANVLSVEVFRETTDVATAGQFVSVLVDLEEKIEITNGAIMEVYGKQENQK